MHKYSSQLYINFSVVATLDFEQSTYTANEFDGSVQPVIVSSNPLSYDITVQVLAIGEYQQCRLIYKLYLICDYTGSSENYTSERYNVTISAGTTRASIYVPVINDDSLDFNKNFDLIINQSSLPFNVDVGNTYQTTVIIVDDDGKGYSYALTFVILVVLTSS